MSLSRHIATLLLVGSLGACTIPDPRVMLGDGSEGARDKAIAALSRGDLLQAERQAVLALQGSPYDPHSLLVAGLANEGMGNLDLARDYYAVIVTNQLGGTVMVPASEGGSQPRPIMEVARVNMAALDRSQRSGTIAYSGKPAWAGTSAQGLPPLPHIKPINAQGPTAAPALTDDNVIARFEMLSALKAQALITDQEYENRRKANLGALLPFFQPPAAKGLDRSIPRGQAIPNRLRELAASLESRAIDANQHEVERLAILDALIPAVPNTRTSAPLPPADMIEASRLLGRVEKLKNAGLISEAEAKAEQTALQRALDQAQSSQRSVQTTGLSSSVAASPVVIPVTTPALVAQPVTAAASSAIVHGIRLGSANSQTAAQATWDSLKKKFPVELGGLQGSVVQTSRNGVTRWLVMAGPMASKDQAEEMCKTLRLHRQACDPTGL